MMHRAASFLPLLLAAMLVLVALRPAGAVAQPSEQAVKAAFLPKFARYVTWPAGSRPPAGSPIHLCLVGTDPFGQIINRAIQGQVIDQNPIVLRRVEAPNTSGCHVAFVHGRGAPEVSAALAALRARPVLTVTDERAGGARGMIHFALHEGRVRFHIDEAAAARSNLALSSRLLALALSVRQRQ